MPACCTELRKQHLLMESDASAEAGTLLRQFVEQTSGDTERFARRLHEGTACCPHLAETRREADTAVLTDHGDLNNSPVARDRKQRNYAGEGKVDMLDALSLLLQLTGMHKRRRFRK